MLKKLRMALAIVLCFTLVLSVSAITVQAETTSKKSVTVTMTEEKPSCTYNFSLKKEAKVRVKVKVLNAAGTAKDKTTYFGEYLSDSSKGSLFYSLKTSELKKNKTFTSAEFVEFPCKSGKVYFHLPEGMKKLKIKVTFSSADGRKVIESLKKAK